MPPAADGPRPRLRSKETPPSGGRSRASRRATGMAGNLGRVLALAAIVVGTGVVAGMALGYPIEALDFGSSDAVSLDQEALSGTIDAEQALVQLEDLPKSTSFTAAPDSSGVNLLGASYCGHSVELDRAVGENLTRAYVDSTNNSLFLAEVARVRQASDAGKYVREMIDLFRDCGRNRYFQVENGTKVEVRIVSDRRDPPLADNYITRTLEPVEGGTIRVVTYFQIGNVVVAMQYAGPNPVPKTLMRDAERAVLYRVAPDQFSKTARIKGRKPLPDETTTTSLPDLVEPSPTSSPPIPTTVAPPPTFEPPTTTKAPRRKSTATTAPPATQPVVTAPAGQ